MPASCLIVSLCGHLTAQNSGEPQMTSLEISTLLSTLRSKISHSQQPTGLSMKLNENTGKRHTSLGLNSRLQLKLIQQIEHSDINAQGAAGTVRPPSCPAIPRMDERSRESRPSRPHFSFRALGLCSLLRGPLHHHANIADVRYYCYIGHTGSHGL